MLFKTKTLETYKLNSLEGILGRVKEFYFDDRYWAVRYLVADTGSWLSERQVLIAPYALAAVNEEERSISINLTKERIKASPSLNSDKPVSRQFEEDYYGYYEWPTYWGGPQTWGSFPYIERNRAKWNKSAQQTWDRHLRSTNAVTGYHIQATDGEIGHVEDFVIDDETWQIRYLVVATHNWWPGKKVLISPQWLDRVSWSESKVFVNLSREIIKQSPEFTEEMLITRDYESGLFGHYRFDGYWVCETPDKETAILHS